MILKIQIKYLLVAKYNSNFLYIMEQEYARKKKLEVWVPLNSVSKIKYSLGKEKPDQGWIKPKLGLAQLGLSHNFHGLNSAWLESGLSKNGLAWLKP